MQINQVTLSDLGKTKETESKQNEKTGLQNIKQQENVSLRPLSLTKDATYNKNALQEEGMLKTATGVQSATDKAATLKNEMILAASTTTDADFNEMQKNGICAKDMDEKSYVTVSDKIKLSLAKGGADISMMGGLSESKIASMTGSTQYATAMENSLQNQDLNTDPKTMDDAKTAVLKSSEIEEKTEDGLSEEAKKYLLKNESEPTIENIYQAVYGAGSTGSQSETVTENSKENPVTGYDALPDTIKQQMAAVIADAGYPADQTQTGNMAFLLDNDLPATKENLTYLNQLNTFEVPTAQKLIEKMTDAVAEGKMPQQAYLIDGYSMADQAKAAMETVNQATGADVKTICENGASLTIENLRRAAAETSTAETNPVAAETSTAETHPVAAETAQTTTPATLHAYRVLEETRLSMTTQANFSLLKQGIAIDTTDLSELVEKLKQQETSMASILQGSANDTEDEARIDLEQQQTMASQIEQLQGFSATTIGAVSISMTMRTSTVSAVNAAAKQYETMGTEVRSDLGDSMKKAFSNIGSLLAELGLKDSDSNEEAVRILGYNRTEITAENVETVKDANELVKRTFQNMTLGVVAEMIKNGTNPLDMTMEELNETADTIKENKSDTDSKEKYAKFLWKMEHTEDISEEERTSFVGMYRLIHQVNETDGAAIGMVLSQGRDLTMRNLMTAVQSKKHTNQDTTVDDQYGMLTGFTKESLSVTEQITMAFETNRMKDAEEEITPAKLKQSSSGQAYMEMSPDELASSFENVKTAEDERLDTEYRTGQREEIITAVSSETSVYEALQSMDIAQSPANLMAMTAAMTNRNGVFQTLLSTKHVNNDGSVVDVKNPDMDALIEDCLEAFGEDAKTPEEMADAQEKLADTAESVIKRAMLSDSISSDDLKALQLSDSQISLFSDMAKTETYNVPVMVADEYGNMTLKIVRGTKEKGLVDVALETKATGKIRATFSCQEKTVDGEIQSDSEGTQKLFSDNAQMLAEKISDNAGLSVSLKFAWNQNVTLQDIYTSASRTTGTRDEAGDSRENSTDTEAAGSRDRIQTTALYGIARAFMDTVNELVAG